MKRVVALVLLIALMAATPARAEENAGPPLPLDSSELSLELAAYALKLAMGHYAEATAAIFAREGFEVLAQGHYDKADDDVSHTTAYTVGRRDVVLGGEARSLVAIAVRGTNAAEWQANFDFAPSRSDATMFAENFLFAAVDVYLAARPFIEAEDDPLILVCGHSRGAACANLLGVLLDEERGQRGVYAYTFATPNTVRGGFDASAYANIYNFINPADVVPMVPLAEWGYARAGTDVTLPGDAELAARARAAMASLSALAPGISEYYGARHSLAGAGLSGDGLTARELMLALSPYLATGLTGEAGGGWEDFAALAASGSDFGELLTLVGKLGSGGGVLAQHMPNTYMALIEALAEEG